jgi:hypothetical protein
VHYWRKEKYEKEKSKKKNATVVNMPGKVYNSCIWISERTMDKCSRAKVYVFVTAKLKDYFKSYETRMMARKIQLWHTALLHKYNSCNAA